MFDHAYLDKNLAEQKLEQYNTSSKTELLTWECME